MPMVMKQKWAYLHYLLSYYLYYLHPCIWVLDKGFSHLVALAGNASRKRTSLPCVPCRRSCFPHWAWGTPCSSRYEVASRQGSRSRLGWRWGYPSWQSWPNTSSCPWTDPPANPNSNVFILYRVLSSRVSFKFRLQFLVSFIRPLVVHCHSVQSLRGNKFLTTLMYPFFFS